MILFLTIIKYWILLGIAVHLFRAIFWIADGMSLKYIWFAFIPEFANRLMIHIFIRKFKKIKIGDEQYILKHINTQNNVYQIEFTNKRNDSSYSQPALTIRDAILNSLVMISDLNKKKPASIPRNLQYFRSKL